MERGNEFVKDFLEKLYDFIARIYEIAINLIAIAIFFIVFCFVPASLLHSCGQADSEESNQQVEELHSPRNDNVYEDDLLPPPEEYIYDEYGVLYQLVDGTYDKYQMVEDYQEEIETPDSTAFTRIWYWPFHEELNVEFRNSGAWYIYYDVPVEVWHSFKNAESKGSFFNTDIKGKYEYERGD